MQAMIRRTGTASWVTLLVLCAFLPIIEAFLVPQPNVSLLRITNRIDRRTELYGVLSRSTILTSKERNKQRNNRLSSDKNKKQHFTPRITLGLISGAVDEALFRQQKILDALSDNEEEKKDGSSQKDATNTIYMRRKEITALKEKLLCLQEQVYELKEIEKSSTSTPRKERTKRIIASLKELGFESILHSNPDEWLSRKDRQKEFGRPKGFDGLVFTSPAGVPILVGRENAHSDEALRRASQGSDLWFQVADYDGSRVLLRSSLRKGMKGSKKCVQMAADLAAYFSCHRYCDDEGVRVMYTDSRHVAKRGSKVGQMRQSKSLGYVVGHPMDVEDAVSKL